MPGISKFYSKISQRWVTVFLSFTIYLNMCGIRACLPIAITEMTIPPNHTKAFSNDTCLQDYKRSNNTYTKHTETPNKNRYNWSEHTRGLILSSFYWSFIVATFLGSTISRKFGSKRTLSLSTLFASTFTLLIPCCAEWGGSAGLIILRLATGVAEGFVQPSLMTLVAHWIPIDECSKAGAVIYTAVPLGSIFGLLPSGIIMQHSNWRTVFYFFGSGGLVTFMLTIAFCYDSPTENPFVSDEELNYLTNALKNKHSTLPAAPWRYILRSPPVWALVAGIAGHMCSIAINMSDMPKHMSGALRLSVQRNGFASSIPHLSMCISGNAFGWIADKLVAKGVASVTTVRKFGCTLAPIGFSAFLVAASYAGCDGAVVTVLLSAGACCAGGMLFSTSINAVDLSRNYAGTIVGMAHGIGIVAAMLTPYVVGVTTPNQTLGEWRAAFWLVFGVIMTSGLVFAFYASGEVQEWNDPAFFGGKRSARENDAKEGVDLLKVPE